MTSVEIMTRYAIQLALNGDREAMARAAANLAQRDEPGNVVSIAAERTRRATRRMMRAQGF